MRGTGPAAPPDSRWSDVLARRVLTELPEDEQVSVAQAGIGGNTVARDCMILGGNAFGNVQDRFDRDVLSRSGLSHVVVYAGTNDIGNGCSAETIIGGFRDVIQRARARDVETVVATVTPRALCTPAQDEQRKAVDDWIRRFGRCGGECAGVVDVDAAVAWSLYPNAIDQRYDSGDPIHPNAEGCAAMGEAIDVELFRGTVRP